ncbi:NAD(P)/FAD-dependent oxidoreductase [Ruminiclostridium cellobioparum]|uniref:Putative FAD-dependent dehydrogenase n=1 Tax=Ruminiclostridium cellobioparum subsp. termitidis CT1112 TaxID=1195236 RepID=S0FN95_RUMCE|nr:NAD(P)/FAD-dependent oxidoreductase [Ruminiclostridium cellobioparum]EMS73720.1 putative FAD-dependent dehydrogenase [Ruminiclostridium cellobioparum subsp. termitidis CT1112]
MYDVAIIGCGISGIFAGYELTKKNPDLKVVMIEQGNDIFGRNCPIIANKIKDCIRCKTCDIMRGFGGAGAFSDGKFNFTTEFGGWLNDYLDDKEVMDLINYVDSVNVDFGATKEMFSTYTPEAKAIEKRALENDLHLLQAAVKHLGTENNLEILKRLYKYLLERLEMLCNTQVLNITPSENGYTIELHNEKTIECKYLIVAPGRSGAEWFSKQCKQLKLDMINNQVDIGVRVELPAKVFEHITDVVYESKLVYRTKQYGDLVRTFCMNPYGHVVSENVDGIVTVNGHSYTDPSLRSENTNFALLVSNRFTHPFNEPYQYGKRIASLSNMLGGGVLVQRFGDLIKGARTNAHRLGQSFTHPTLNATPGDLSLVLTKRHLDNIIEMIYALDKIAPGTANYDTLLYGVEVKFYSSRLELTNELETKLPNMFAIGDGAGVTRGLSQASASGVHVARTISDRISKS